MAQYVRYKFYSNIHGTMLKNYFLIAETIIAFYLLL